MMLNTFNFVDAVLSGIGFGTLRIASVLFNGPATIVFWADGTKTVVKCSEKEEFDPEKAIAMAIVKNIYGEGYYSRIIKPLASAYIPKEKKHRKTFREELMNTHPEKVSSIAKGGAFGCPSEYFKNATFFCCETNNDDPSYTTC